MEFIKGNLISIHFDSMLEFYNSKPSKVNADLCESMKARGNQLGDLGPTSKGVQDSIDKSVVGDEKLKAQYLDGMVAELNYNLKLSDSKQKLPVIKRKRVRKEFGDELDMQMVYQGKLDKAWTKTEKVEFDSQHHLITLLIDIGGRHNVDAVQSLWTAAAALKFCQEVERAGKNIQVIVGNVSAHAAPGYSVSTTACVKKYSDPLNFERLAAMTHIGFYRSFGFLGKLSSSKKIDSSMGSSFDLSSCVPIPLREAQEKGETKIIALRKALNLKGALASLKAAERDMIK